MEQLSRDERRRAPSLAYRLGLQRNEDKPCGASGCSRHRYHLEGWCKAHLTSALRYGHPRGKPLKRANWAGYRKLVQEVYDRNAGHPGLVEGLRVVDDYLARGAASLDAFRGASEVRRLCAAGVTARTVLVELCACSMYLDAHPSSVPDDRSADFALSRAILSLAPRPRKVSWASGKPKSYGTKANRSALLGIGSTLRVALSPLIVQTRIAVKGNEQRKSMTAAQVEAERRAPFITG